MSEQNKLITEGPQIAGSRLRRRIERAAPSKSPSATRRTKSRIGTTGGFASVISTAGIAVAIGVVLAYSLLRSPASQRFLAELLIAVEVVAVSPCGHL